MPLEMYEKPMYNHDEFTAISIAQLLAASNWQAQYRLITQWGKLIQVKPEVRLPAHLLKGCETLAWLAHREQDGLHRFAFDSDSRVINGLAALLLAQLHGKTTAEIKAINMANVLAEIGLEKHLTPSRNNGLHAIIVRVQACVNAPVGVQNIL